MEYYLAIKKNTFESVLMRWMKLEPIIQIEVSQKEKDNVICINKGQKWYGHNRSRRYEEGVVRIHRRTIQKRSS